MICFVLMLLTKFAGLATDSGTYIVINEIYNAIFSFLPIYLAYAAAVKWKANPYIAVAVALTMCSSTIQGLVLGDGLKFLGIPLSMQRQGYGSSVIPIIVTIWFMSLVEKTATKYIPKYARYVLVPLCTKNTELRETALSAGIAGVFAITEPAIYGVNLPLKKPFYIAVIFAAIAGGIAGFGNAAALAGGPVGILSFPLFIGEDFGYFVVAMLVALFGTAIAVYLFGYDKKYDQE